jgi:tetratricopeptide (TPR) repeat protein
MPLPTNGAPTDPRALLEHARSVERAGQTTSAATLYDASLAGLGSSDDVRLLAVVLRRKGNLQLQRGETAEAESNYRLSHAIAVAVGDLGGIAQALNCLASVAHRRGQLVEAERQYQDAAVVAERAGERRLTGMIQQNLGVRASIRGDWDAA